MRRDSCRLTTMLFLDRASVTLALASWGFFFFFFSVLAAVFGFVALAARAAVAFVRAVAVALAGRVAVVFAGRAVEVALAGFVAVALAGLVAVALAGLAAVLFTGTLAAVGADAIAGGASTTGAASAAAGAARNATPRCCKTFLLVEAGCTGILGVGFSPEVNASSSSAQASRNPAIGAQGHRLQVGVFCRAQSAKNDKSSNGIRTKRPVWLQATVQLTQGPAPFRQPRGGRNKRTARDQDAHTDSYGSLSKILQRVRAGGRPGVRSPLVARRPSSKQSITNKCDAARGG